jgi:hypothetical protein
MTRRRHLLLTWLISLGLACALWSAGRMHVVGATAEFLASLCSVSATHALPAEASQDAAPIDTAAAHPAACDLCCAPVLALLPPASPQHAAPAPSHAWRLAGLASDPVVTGLDWPGPRPRGPPAAA